MPSEWELPGPAGLAHIRLRWSRYANVFGRTGIVYYLERADGLIKIGYTHSYPRRRQDLFARHSHLRLLAWELGSYHLERLRHSQFDGLRLDPIAEWFALGASLREHIIDLRNRGAVSGAP